MLKRVVLWVCLGCVGEARAEDWPQFRGAGGSGVSHETGLPVRWSKHDNLRWVADLPGRGLSSPVIAQGKVYVTACTGYQQNRLHVLCFAADTGKLLWQRQLWATGCTLCNQKTCMAAPSPVTDGARVFALFATTDLVAFDADGNLLWYRSLIRDYPTIGNNVGIAASPILARDTLLIPMENAGESFALGVDARTGKNRWKVERHRDINWTTPLLRNNGEVLFQSNKEITAYDPATGRQRWTFAAGLGTSPSPISGGDDVVFVPAGGRVLALKPGADNLPPRLLWESNKIKSSFASPLFHQGRVYTVHAPVVSCADAATGKLLWSERVKGAYSASPVVAEGKIYVLNEEGATTVIQLGDQPKTLSVNALEDTMLATPAISGGAIYLRSDQHLFCIAEKTK